MAAGGDGLRRRSRHHRLSLGGGSKDQAGAARCAPRASAAAPAAGNHRDRGRRALGRADATRRLANAGGTSPQPARTEREIAGVPEEAVVMRFRSGRNRPSWRSPEAGVMRPGLWLGALVLVGVLLVEVGQSSRMA